MSWTKINPVSTSWTPIPPISPITGGDWFMYAWFGSGFFTGESITWTKIEPVSTTWIEV